MKIIKNLIPFSKGKRPGTKIKPTSITIHSTGNPNSTAENERAWLTNPSNNRLASYHIVVDENKAIMAIPLNEISYHSGNSVGNSTSIGIEICESGDREQTLRNAAEVVIELQKQLDITTIKRHFDRSGKICPRIMSANNWQGWKDFLKLIENIKEGNEMSPEQVEKLIDEKIELALKPSIKDEGMSPDHWGYEFIVEANSKGAGITDLRLNDKATRAEVVAFVMKILKAYDLVK